LGGRWGEGGESGGPEDRGEGRGWVAGVGREPGGEGLSEGRSGEMRRGENNLKRGNSTKKIFKGKNIEDGIDSNR